MPSFDEPILRMARRVADIKRGRESIEEKAEAIGSFVTSSFTSFLVASKEEKWTAATETEPSRPFVEETAEWLYRVCPAPPAPAPPPLRIIHITSPIMVRKLATQLGLEPQRIISELMSFNILANINQTIEADIASRIAENHGFVLEIEGPEKADASEKVEQVLTAPPPSVIEERPDIRSLEEVIHALDADTILFLHTADMLGAALREHDLDWSPAVIMLCKAFEKETNIRLVVPLREKTSGRDLTADLSDNDLGRIARFCSAVGQPPELGTLGHFLNTAIHSKQRRATSILLQSFYELVSDWPRSQWLVDEFGLAATLKKLTQEFRNPAAHIDKLSESDFDKCRNFVREAPEIVMLKLFLATSR